MAHFVKVATTDELEDQQAKKVEVEGQKIAASVRARHAIRTRARAGGMRAALAETGDGPGRQGLRVGSAERLLPPPRRGGEVLPRGLPDRAAQPAQSWSVPAGRRAGGRGGRLRAPRLAARGTRQTVRSLQEAATLRRGPTPRAIGAAMTYSLAVSLLLGLIGAVLWIERAAPAHVGRVAAAGGDPGRRRPAGAAVPALLLAPALSGQRHASPITPVRVNVSAPPESPTEARCSAEACYGAGGRRGSADGAMVAARWAARMLPNSRESPGDPVRGATLPAMTRGQAARTTLVAEAAA